MGTPPSMGIALGRVRTGVRFCVTRVSASAVLGRVTLPAVWACWMALSMLPVCVSSQALESEQMPAVVHKSDADVPRVLDGFFLSRGRPFCGSRQGDDFLVGELRPGSPAAQQASTQGHQAPQAERRTQETSLPSFVPSPTRRGG